MRLFALLLMAAAAFAEPHIFYSKSFPGSAPAYLEITLEKSGEGVYKEAPDDDRVEANDDDAVTCASAARFAEVALGILP